MEHGPLGQADRSLLNDRSVVHEAKGQIKCHCKKNKSLIAYFLISVAKEVLVQKIYSTQQNGITKTVHSGRHNFSKLSGPLYLLYFFVLPLG